MHEGAILIIGLHAGRLAAVFDDFFLEALNVDFKLAAIGFIPLDLGLGFFHGGLVLGQLLFDGGHPLGQAGHLLDQPCGLPINLFQLD